MRGTAYEASNPGVWCSQNDQSNLFSNTPPHVFQVLRCAHGFPGDLTRVQLNLNSLCLQCTSCSRHRDTATGQQARLLSLLLYHLAESVKGKMPREGGGKLQEQLPCTYTDHGTWEFQCTLYSLFLIFLGFSLPIKLYQTISCHTAFMLNT